MSDIERVMNIVFDALSNHSFIEESIQSGKRRLVVLTENNKRCVIEFGNC